MPKILFSFLVLFLLTSILHAQNKILKGRIIDNNLEIFPYVSIFINDTVQVGKTDLKGFFEINIPISVKKISFESVGVHPAIVIPNELCDRVEVVLILSGSYDLKSPKRVDRLRRREFDKLPKIHREAFKRGIFKTDKACYKQAFFVSYKKYTSKKYNTDGAMN